MDRAEILDKVAVLEDQLVMAWKQRNSYNSSTYDWSDMEKLCDEIGDKIDTLYRQIGRSFSSAERRALYTARVGSL